MGGEEGGEGGGGRAVCSLTMSLRINSRFRNVAFDRLTVSRATKNHEILLKVTFWALLLLYFVFDFIGQFRL